jgi:hypothetical protein
MYLLIVDEENTSAVESDLQAEIEAQLETSVPIRSITEDNISTLTVMGPISILRIRDWWPGLVTFLDTHVVRLERTGSQFIFLSTSTLAERLLLAGPNFRNRLTEILTILPDTQSGDSLN